MSHSPRNLDPAFPNHICARSNNKEHFPIPLEEAWELFSNYLYFINQAFEIKIHAFVLMPNHFHLLASAPKGNLAEAMNYFMRETSRIASRSAGRINRMWGAPYHSTSIRSSSYFFSAYKYVYRNPVAARLCSQPIDHQFSTLRGLLGFESIIIPVEADETLFSNVEDTLNWLATPSHKEEIETIRRALRRRIFTIGTNPNTRKPFQLLDFPEPKVI